MVCVICHSSSESCYFLQAIKSDYTIATLGRLLKELSKHCEISFDSKNYEDLCIKIMENVHILKLKHLDFYFTKYRFMAKNIVFKSLRQICGFGDHRASSIQIVFTSYWYAHRKCVKTFDINISFFFFFFLIYGNYNEIHHTTNHIY